MLCRCVASGRPGYVRIVETDGRVAWALCSDCGGSGVASCCDLAGAPNLASSLSRLPQPRGSALDGDGRLARNAGRLRASTSIQKNPVSRWRLTLTCRATGTYPVSRRHQFTGRDRLRQKISLHSRRVRAAGTCTPASFAASCADGSAPIAGAAKAGGQRVAPRTATNAFMASSSAARAMHRTYANVL